MIRANRKWIPLAVYCFVVVPILFQFHVPSEWRDRFICIIGFFAGYFVRMAAEAEESRDPSD